MKTTLILVLLVVSAAALAACNTTKGAGKDLQSAGKGIENSAERNGAK
jgi:entericidin B